MGEVKKEHLPSYPNVNDIKNFSPRAGGGFARLGYRHFLGLLWALFKANRQSKRSECTARFEFTLPIPWF